jgi:acyl-CoA dehydrogenase
MFPDLIIRRSVQKRRYFFERYVLPHNAAWYQGLADGMYAAPFLADLKALARDKGF